MSAIIRLTAIALVIVILTSCGAITEAREPDLIVYDFVLPDDVNLLYTELTTVSYETLAPSISLNGILNYYDVEPVQFEFDEGFLEEIYVMEGDFVRKGDILALQTFENDFVLHELEQRRLDYQNDIETFGNRLTDLERRITNQVNLNTTYEEPHERVIGQLNLQLLQLELDNHRNASRENLDDLRDRINELNRMLRGVYVIAPRDGVVSNLMRHRENTPADTSTVLCTIIDTSKYLIQVDLVRSLTRNGSRVNLIVRDETYDALIIASPRFRQYGQDNINPDDIIRATIEITDERFNITDLDRYEPIHVEFVSFVVDNVLVVPSTFIYRLDDRRYVRLYENGTIKRRYVQTGITVGDRVQIVTGLEAGMVVAR
jgi:multidrug efflux pump subunit AcrA (membrane-fusion protein)